MMDEERIALTKTALSSFHDCAWAVWHEGSVPFAPPGGEEFIPVADFRHNARWHNQENRGAVGRIDLTSDAELLEHMQRIPAYIESDRGFAYYWNYVIAFEDFSVRLKEALAREDWEGVGEIFRWTHRNNPDARHLLAGLRRSRVRELINSI